MTLKQRFLPYIANMSLIWLTFYLYQIIPYYINSTSSDTFDLINKFALGYTMLGFIYYLFLSTQPPVSKGQLVWRAIKKFFINIRNITSHKFSYDKNLIILTKEEKIALRFYLVKFIFVPMMLGFFINNTDQVFTQYQAWRARNFALNVQLFNSIIFPLIIISILFVDVVYFSFGYLFESKKLNNTIRSVEPTVLGWVVALACYPPLNGVTSNLFGWYANDSNMFSSPKQTVVLRVFIIILFLIYVWATLALGTKASNLTNRGIVSRGPYKYVRHPAYISKNLAWLLMALPVMSWPALLSVSAWAGVYHLRAVTEEKHLGLDPDYQKYITNVRWRYIPKIL